jgi:hypothetical protein
MVALVNRSRMVRAGERAARNRSRSNGNNSSARKLCVGV